MENSTNFRVIGKNLRQCLECNQIIRGSSYNIKRHLQIHNKKKLAFVCPGCPKLYSRKHYLKKHAEKVHHMYLGECYQIEVELPEIEPVKEWKPPFEATPRFKIVPAPSKYKEPEPVDQIQNLISEMVYLPRPISPLPEDPDTINSTGEITTDTEDTTFWATPAPYLETDSNTTICLDERSENLQETDIYIYSIYGIFS